MDTLYYVAEITDPIDQRVYDCWDHKLDATRQTNRLNRGFNPRRNRRHKGTRRTFEVQISKPIAELTVKERASRLPFVLARCIL